MDKKLVLQKFGIHRNGVQCVVHFYRTMNYFRRGRENKFVANDEDLSHGSIYADDIDDISSLDKPKTNPFITSYTTPTNNNPPKTSFDYFI